MRSDDEVTGRRPRFGSSAVTTFQEGDLTEPVLGGVGHRNAHRQDYTLPGMTPAAVLPGN